MNNQEWGVTERGFHRPTYVELLDAIEYKARELFGSKANLTVRSPLGIFLRIFGMDAEHPVQPHGRCLQ